MCGSAWYIFSRSFALCLWFLVCALLLTLGLSSGPDSYHLLKTARALNESAQAVLLIGILFSAIVEDYCIRR